jgi:hypothetical protein
MTDQTNTDAARRRQFQPGTGRPVEPGKRPVGDPILNAISAYRNSLAQFTAFSKTDVTDQQRDQYAETSYLPPMEALQHWEGGPARSFDGARDAIRMALDEEKDFSSSSMVPRMLEAALGYLDKPAVDGIYGDLSAFSLTDLRLAAECLTTLHSVALMFAVSPWIETHGRGHRHNACQQWAWDICRQLCGEAEAIVVEARRRPRGAEYEEDLDDVLLAAFSLLEEPPFRRAIVEDAA